MHSNVKFHKLYLLEFKSTPIELLPKGEKQKAPLFSPGESIVPQA
jgi:hypothetical protein